MTESSHTVISIDGPAASGKSSVARTLAKRLGYNYVNSGAMYRAVTWFVLHEQIDPRHTTAVLESLGVMKIRCGWEAGDSTITINDQDPTPFLCDENVNQNVSTIASIPRVRRTLVDLQRASAKSNDLVMEGRDIGSVVFPETPYKFYIDASPDVRARRRALQGLTDEIIARDRRDSSRRASPLVIAEDAHVIDSSNLTIDGVVGEIIGRLKMKGLHVRE